MRTIALVLLCVALLSAAAGCIDINGRRRPWRRPFRAPAPAPIQCPGGVCPVQSPLVAP